MATTFTDLTVGQKEKEVTINTNFAQVPRYLGELTADPATAGVSAGSTYFNTTASKLKVLKGSGVWTNVA